jgi:predicted aconitase with swiveling domain/uncharacterized protein with ATP-grasp and redox domains
MRLHGRTIYPATAEGEALVTSLGISFFGGVDPETGVVVERGHELEGQSIAGKILVFPTGKGSTVGSYTLYRLKANGKSPLAIINAECETITAVGCILAEIPCVDKISLRRIKNGQHLRVDGQSGLVISLPGIDLPEPLRGLDGSFTYDTITQRLPGIARRVIAENSWSVDIENKLQALIDEMPEAGLRPLQDSGAPDLQAWNMDLQPYLGQTWLQAPWFVVETYFFRRILEATGYFHDGSNHGLDPYRMQKRQAQQDVSEQLDPLCARLEELLVSSSGERSAYLALLAHLLRLGVWANQSDLSMWPAGSGMGPMAKPAVLTSTGSMDTHLLRDDAQVAARFLLNLKKDPTRIDFILDNGGAELSHDLVLADFLLTSRLVQTVHFHCKAHPTYVSDVTRPDVSDTLEMFAAFGSRVMQNLAERLSLYLSSGQLSLHDHFFWNSSSSGWEIPQELWDELAQSDLIINKGDHNYRRWLGDLHWSPDAPLDQILDYLPAPWLALRVFKAEIVAGLRTGIAETIHQQDPTWLFNGRWGLIEFVQGAHQ